MSGMVFARRVRVSRDRGWNKGFKGEDQGNYLGARGSDLPRP